jgi:integrase
MKKSSRGSGTVYLRGKIWWIQYWDHGRPRNESSKSEDKGVAEALLRQRVTDVIANRDLTPEKCTIADLCRLVLADYRLRKLRDAQIVQLRYNAHVKEALGHLQAGRLSRAILWRYIEDRRHAGAEDATINRELSIVRRGYTLGAEEDPPLVRRVPKIPKLEEDNARQGFLEPVCAYHVGTREGELRKIRIEQVDFVAKTIRIERAQAKGKKPRTLPIYGDMERWLQVQIEAARPGCPWIFHNGKGRLVGAQMEGWRAACEAAGMAGLYFHDLRRSAVRNLKRAGVQDKVAMEISGHKTRSVFDRYNIVDEGDIEAAGEKLSRYFADRKKVRAAKLRRVR